MSRPALDIFPPGYRFEDDDGEVLNAGKLYFYEPDQAYSTQKTVYKDRAKGTAWTQPVTLTSDGRLTSPVKSDGLVDVVVMNSAETETIDTHDNAGDDWSAVGTDLSENLLSNGSAETAGSGGESFANFTDTDSGSVISRDSSDPYHGAACFLFTNSQNGADYTTSDFFPVSPGKDIGFDFFVKASNANAEPKIQLAWYTGAQGSISTSTIYDDNVGLTPTSWTLKQGFRATPPSTARYAKLVLVGNDNATQYTTRFDGIRVFPIATFPENAPYKPFGLETSIDSGDAQHDINTTAGAVKSDDFADDMILPVEITKKMDATWAAGDDQGGLESGGTVPSDGLLYIWLIKNSSTGHVDVLLSESAYSPTMPSGYDVKRYLNAIPTDTSATNFSSVTWKGGYCDIGARMAADVDSAALSDNTYVEYEISAPPESIATMHVLLIEQSNDFMGNCWVKFRPTTSSATEHIEQGIDINGSDVDRVVTTVYFRLDANSSCDITPDFSDTSTDPKLTVRVTGWHDLRRDNP